MFVLLTALAGRFQICAKLLRPGATTKYCCQVLLLGKSPHVVDDRFAADRLIDCAVKLQPRGTATGARPARLGGLPGLGSALDYLFRMLSRQRITLLGAFFGCAVSACSDDSDSPGGAAKGGAVALTNANNYTAESRLTIPSLDVAADADLDIC